MRLKKFMVTAMATVLSLSLLGGCGKKVTVDDIMQKNNDRSVEMAKQIDAVLADSKLTYDEYKALFGLVPEGVLDVGLDGAATITVAQSGMTVSVKGDVDADFEVQVDPVDMEFSLTGKVGMSYELMGESEEEEVSVGIYLVKEDDGYYMYTKEDDLAAERSYVGNIEDLFAEPLDLSEVVESLGGTTFEAQMKEQTAKTPFVDKMVLLEETKKYEDAECYVVSLDITWDMIKNVLETNPEFKAALEESGMSLEEMLAEEIATGLTMKDIFECLTLKCQYYYTTDEYELVYFDADMKDAGAAMVGAVGKVLKAEEGMELTADFSELKATYGYKKCDVDVKFDGEFVDEGEREADLPLPGATGEVEAEIKFDSNVKLEVENLMSINIGGTKGVIGTMPVDEINKKGYISSNGKAIVFEDDYLYGYAKGYDVFAMSENGILDDFSVSVDKLSFGTDNYPVIEVEYTNHGIKLGQSVDVLAKLGEPAYTSKNGDVYDYEWEIDADDAWYCFDVSTEDGKIIAISAYKL